MKKNVCQPRPTAVMILNDTEQYRTIWSVRYMVSSMRTRVVNIIIPLLKQQTWALSPHRIWIGRCWQHRDYPEPGASPLGDVQLAVQRARQGE